jgi:predicted nucleic acid-binding protein
VLLCDVIVLVFAHRYDTCARAEIFQSSSLAHAVRGNLVPDAYLAAMAIESGCEWVTTDRDFSRFEGLRTRNPTS